MFYKGKKWAYPLRIYQEITHVFSCVLHQAVRSTPFSFGSGNSTLMLQEAINYPCSQMVSALKIECLSSQMSLIRVKDFPKKLYFEYLLASEIFLVFLYYKTLLYMYTYLHAQMYNCNLLSLLNVCVYVFSLTIWCWITNWCALSCARPFLLCSAFLSVL